MSKLRKQDGVVYTRKDGKILWIRYWDRNGKPRRESSHTADWEEANRKLRERLQARDGNLLEVIRQGEALSFGEWADSFLKSYSKPPIRAAKTHEANMRCVAHLKAVFGDSKLVDLTADAIEQYLCDRLEQRVRIKVQRRLPRQGASQIVNCAPGVSGSQAYLKRGGTQEIARRQSLFRGRISGHREGPVPTALRYLVRAGKDRLTRTRTFAQHRADHYGNGVASL